MNWRRTIVIGNANVPRDTLGRPARFRCATTIPVSMAARAFRIRAAATSVSVRSASMDITANTVSIDMRWVWVWRDLILWLNGFRSKGRAKKRICRLLSRLAVECLSDLEIGIDLDLSCRREKRLTTNGAILNINILGDEQRTRDEITVLVYPFRCLAENLCVVIATVFGCRRIPQPCRLLRLHLALQLFSVTICFACKLVALLFVCQTLCYAPKLITIKTVNAMITRDAELVSQDVSLPTTFIWRLICINSLERSTRWDEIRGTERKPEVVFVKWDYIGGEHFLERQ